MRSAFSSYQHKYSIKIKTSEGFKSSDVLQICLLTPQTPKGAYVMF